jgi:hypothetical protein
MIKIMYRRKKHENIRIEFKTKKPNEKMKDKRIKVENRRWIQKDIDKAKIKKN